MPSRVPPQLASRLAALVLLAGLGGGAYVAEHETDEALRDEYVRAVAADATTSPAVKIAMVMGAHYESSGRHIGAPYIDRNGRGQPLTVCNGVTGVGVVAGRYYTPADCYQLERARYIVAEREAARLLPRWTSYDPFVQATFVDFTWNKGAQALAGSTMRTKANRGDLKGACMENPRWNRGTVRGASVVLPGLQLRGESNDEICRNWRVNP
ncbi:endolysin [Acidovorax sp. GBBC 3332]|nr:MULTISPECIES: endolysin [unclassified Acidovorax]MDA8448497.1 endolysin [Acidovorax sp. GBBC 3297]MDA8457536.1 endolysin [Acidovorax sp. GBBC 3333]MDA8462940.1 endolysin [Acidovorax sp. GBBC 3332]MDA8467606.1 endolysin [Acidovorax sp. GBBC 3299]